VKDENKLKIFKDAMAIMAVLGLKPLGKLVLEDLKVVFDGGVVASKDVKLQIYDFFKEVRPIKCEPPYVEEATR
jgi:hypothetical protein